MSPREEQQLGEVIGELRGLRSEFTGFGRRLDSMDSSLRAAVEAKASWDWAKAHELHADERNARVDSLESSRDKIRGVLIAMGALQAIATISLLVVGFILNH